MAYSVNSVYFAHTHWILYRSWTLTATVLKEYETSCTFCQLRCQTFHTRCVLSSTTPYHRHSSTKPYHRLSSGSGFRSSLQPSWSWLSFLFFLLLEDDGEWFPLTEQYFKHNHGIKWKRKRREKEKATQAVKATPNINLGKRSHFGTDYRKAPPPQNGKEKSMGIRRVAGLAWYRLLMKVDNSTGKGTPGMDKLSSKVHRVHMELGGKLLNSLRIKTSSLKGFRVWVL